MAAARRLAGDLLAAGAAAVEAAGAVPRSHLDRLAEAGFAGLTGPVGAGGADADPATVAAVVEELAAGDLATTFVWLQHLGAVARLAAAGPPSCARPTSPTSAPVAGAPASRCRRRCGRARRRSGCGGTAPSWPSTSVPWVTGWGLVDLVLVAARDGDDLLFVLADAQDGPTLSPPRSRWPLWRPVSPSSGGPGCTGCPPDAWSSRCRTPTCSPATPPAGGGGSLALGLALRCTRLVGPSPLDDELTAVRAAPDSAGPAGLPAARAAAAAFRCSARARR